MGSQGQLILNPGSIGQPFFYQQVYVRDLRAQYMILDFDGKGLKDIDFRRVDYDVESELQLARDLKLPYYKVYYESLVNGIHHTLIRTCCMKSPRVKGHDVGLTTDLM